MREGKTLPYRCVIFGFVRSPFVADDRWSPLRVKHGAPIGGKSNIGENSGLVAPEFYREPSPSAYPTKSMLPQHKGTRQERSHSCPILICVESFWGVGHVFAKQIMRLGLPSLPSFQKGLTKRFPRFVRRYAFVCGRPMVAPTAQTWCANR